eukprot:CAMPEP_0175296602 /NCGR_PEP_ID=MMETSP0093-20121207/59123_1 /TAXON_ID=311494 /ORGANISM="Alexandrium monilatum, Strain CCMP3105" /LENGTH=34 /DNA_ID= /DNA_START= /DNA_END= /DNA_ORIENTATION=
MAASLSSLAVTTMKLMPSWPSEYSGRVQMSLMAA